MKDSMKIKFRMKINAGKSYYEVRACLRLTINYFKGWGTIFQPLGGTDFFSLLLTFRNLRATNFQLLGVTFRPHSRAPKHTREKDPRY